MSLRPVCKYDDSTKSTFPNATSVVAVLIGLLLVFAGLAKAIATVSFPPDTWRLLTYALGDSLQKFANVTIPPFEIAIGFWIASGVLKRVCQTIAALMFSFFILIQFVNILNSKESCGCFGMIDVNPWIMLILNSIIFCFLSVQLAGNKWFCQPQKSTISSRQVILVLAGISVAVGVFFALAEDPRQTSPRSGISVESKNVFLFPEQWVGTRFPRLPIIENESQFEVDDTCVVVFTNHECAKCQEIVGDLVYDWETNVGPRVFLLNVRPNLEYAGSEFHCVSTTLDPHFEWRVFTPTVVYVRTNQVTKTRRYRR
jgi:hypothetical protein